MNKLKSPITCEAYRIGISLCNENRLLMSQCIAIDRAVALCDEVATRKLIMLHGLMIDGTLEPYNLVTIRDSKYQCKSIW